MDGGTQSIFIRESAVVFLVFRVDESFIYYLVVTNSMVKNYPKLYEKTLVGKVRKFMGFPIQNPNEIADSLRPEYQGDYSLLNLVGMDEATISTAESQRPVIGSVGMGPCIAMVGYDPNQKIGFVSHNGAGNYTGVLHDSVLGELKKKAKSDLEMDIYIVGGMIGSGKLASRLRNIARENFNPRTINEDLALNVSDWTYLGKSFLLDVRDGKVYSIDGGGKLQYVPSAEPRISLRK